MFLWLHLNGSNTTKAERKPQKVHWALVMKTSHRTCAPKMMMEDIIWILKLTNNWNNKNNHFLWLRRKSNLPIDSKFVGALERWWRYLEVNNGHFLGAMGYNVFSRKNHWHQWFFDGFASLWPSPLTTFLITDHWTRWFFNGFGVIQPSPFNDFQPPDHCFQWFFDGFQILDTNGQRWFWK